MRTLTGLRLNNWKSDARTEGMEILAGISSANSQGLLCGSSVTV